MLEKNLKNTVLGMYVIVLLRKYKTGNYRTFFPYVRKEWNKKKCSKCFLVYGLIRFVLNGRKLYLNLLKTFFPRRDFYIVIHNFIFISLQTFFPSFGLWVQQQQYIERNYHLWHHHQVKRQIRQLTAFSVLLSFLIFFYFPSSA